jgi:hypothetical protein
LPLWASRAGKLPFGGGSQRPADVRSDARRRRPTESVVGRGLAAVFDLGEAQVRSFSCFWRLDRLVGAVAWKIRARHLYLAPVFYAPGLVRPDS